MFDDDYCLVIDGAVNDIDDVDCTVNDIDGAVMRRICT